MTEKYENYEDWINEVKRVLVEEFKFPLEIAEQIDEEAWKDYFDEGYEPYQAAHEDMSYAD